MSHWGAAPRLRKSGLESRLMVREPQSSKLKRAVMRKVFIVIVLFIQSCAYLTKVVFSALIQCIANSFGVRLENLNCCCFIASPLR